ncbi:MAG TPA: acyltransferase, partial [Bacillota bacterium]|nr:acyltransferase [Bacillota bacterium]
MSHGKRWLEIDVIRGMCIIGIIFLHMTAYFLSPNLMSYNSFKLNLLINQFVRFTLPLFLFFSGFGLALGYKGDSLRDFFARRLKSVVVPYLVWSLIYFFFALMVLKRVPFRGGMVNLAGSGLTWVDLVREFAINLLFGWNYVHLYFVFLIVQFYIIFPFAYKWLAGVRKPGRFLLGMTVVYLVYLVFVAYYRKYINIPYLTFYYKYYWELAPSWFFYFFTGILAALHFPRFREISEKYEGLFAMLFIITSGLVLGETWYRVFIQHQGVAVLTSLRPTVFLNTLVFIFFLFPLGRRMLKMKLGKMFIF